ncbi:hypothetical protein KXS11_08330 [Plantibacter flavus]|uniref:hypothetical protein n=1 Tax=Plantibacter flavus TaxID=150123 RepID=UPI003F16ED03
MLGVSITSFTSAWSTPSEAARAAFERSLTNERDYIAGQCSKIGAPIDFDGDVAPIAIPRIP